MRMTHAFTRLHFPKASNGRQFAAELAYTSGMKKLGWLLFCALVSSGLAVESSVTIAGTIPGTLSLPNNASGKLPAVLLLHGFASQKDEVGDMYKSLAAKLVAQGIASLRIDFQGSGDSKIPFEQMTFTNQVSDAQAAFDYLKGRPEVDAARLGLLGFSMGGGVAIKLAANAANPVKSLALWSSTSSRSLADIEVGSRATAEKEGVVDVDLGFTKIKLGKAFYNSIQNQNLEADIGKFRGNTMLVYGTALSTRQFPKFQPGQHVQAFAQRGLPENQGQNSRLVQRGVRTTVMTGR
ncbi:hypothetical protein DESA109040_15140 [Deinococcus saxicola]